MWIAAVNQSAMNETVRTILVAYQEAMYDYPCDGPLFVDNPSLEENGNGNIIKSSAASAGRSLPCQFIHHTGRPPRAIPRAQRHSDWTIHDPVGHPRSRAVRRAGDRLAVEGRRGVHEF